MADIRAFFAIEIENQDTLEKIGKFQQELQKSIGPLKLVKPELMHITLRFLGNISEQNAQNLLEFLQKEINSVFFPQGKVYSSSFKGVGDFGKRVFFVKIQEQHDFLQKLNSLIEAKLTEFSGIKAESKPFTPHLTIARAKRSRHSARSNQIIHANAVHPGQLPYSELKKNYANYSFGLWTITKVVLKKSVLTPQGPIYSNFSL
ncbi:RNA 2',3'-cyclic phosphodiesterase [Candidatus Lokiarchaeum ossiferum]|uniref:RNA 2',3'-cyclic phosphodiesterase n=1 Tax=Candidatus Lokiarchaeum ossiferum TaxID=2951803 RepID=UPI00352C688D